MIIFDNELRQNEEICLNIGNGKEVMKVTCFYPGIYSHRVVGANAIKDFFSGIVDFFGGRSRAYDASLNSAKEQVRKEMYEKAIKMGAHAVCNFRLIVSEQPGTKMTQIHATGTPIELGKVEFPSY